MTGAEIKATLQGYSFRFRNERELQDGIRVALYASNVTFEREVEITERDRIDFLCGGIGIEVKVDSSAPAVFRQLHRYAQCPRIDELLLVTSRLKHRGIIPDSINGKPVHAIFLVRL